MAINHKGKFHGRQKSKTKVDKKIKKKQAFKLFSFAF